MKITKEGQPCRKCQTPVIRKFPKERLKRLRQPYYFKSYLFCPGCKTLYMVESEKVFRDGSSPKVETPKEVEDQQKSALFVIFREVLNRNKVALEIQKQIWEELENELGTIINSKKP